MTEGIIFDLDGTLIDSMKIWSEVDRKFFENHKIIPPDDISEIVKKMTIQESSEYIRDNFLPDMKWQEISKEIQSLVRHEYYENIPLKKGVIETLDKLDELNIPYGVATATYPDMAEAVLKRHGILDRMKFVLTQREVPEGKESPDIFLEGAKRLGFTDAENVRKYIVVEDSLHSIQTAKKAGFFVCGIYDETSENLKDEINGNSDIFIYEIPELLQYLELCCASYEKLSDEIYVCKSINHRFGTDAFLLADFANIKHKTKVCDLGTGCGIIPLIWQKRKKPQITYALDIQPDAIKQLEYGIKKSNIEKGKIIPICADMKNLWENAPINTLDVVTCNPPYKAENAGFKSVIESQRIARHEIMCSIDDVCKTAYRLLKSGGTLCLCNRTERLADVLASMKNNNLEPKRLRFIAKNHKSKPWLFLVEARKDGGSFLEVEKTFYLYDENMEYTEDMKKIYM